MTETWQRIARFDNYEVSDLGRVRRRAHVTDSVVRCKCCGAAVITLKKRYTEKILRQTVKRTNGRPTRCAVNLIDNGQKTTIYVHVLVLEAFVGPRPTGYHGCHTDGDATNNQLVNLRWDTAAANRADTVRHGTNPRGESHGRAVINGLVASQIRDLYAKGGSTHDDLAKLFRISASQIGRVLNGEVWA